MRYLDKLDPFKGNVYTAHGKALHAALEHNYRQKITSRIDLPASELVPVFNASFDKELKAIGESMTDAVENMRLQGEEMLYEYLKQIAPFIQPSHVEMKFQIDLQSIGVTILGFLDLITEDEIIVDHKTVGTSTWQTWSKCYVDNLVQLTVYSLAYRKLFNKAERGVRIDLLKRLKGGTTFSQIESRRTDGDVMVLINLIKQMKSIVENDLRYPNLNHCRDCELSDICSRK